MTLLEGSVKVGWSLQVVQKGGKQKFATLVVVGWVLGGLAELGGGDRLEDVGLITSEQ